MLYYNNLTWELNKMSKENKTSIEFELKKINSSLNTLNKIMSNFLVIATTESTFKKLTNEQIKKVVPTVSETIKSINESIYS